MIGGLIIGFFAGWFITAVCMAYHAQRGYIYHSAGRRVKWTHRQALDRGIWDITKLQKK